MYTVFPHIVAAATILFGNCNTFKNSYTVFPRIVSATTIASALVFLLCDENLNSFLTRMRKLFKGGKYSKEGTIWGNMVFHKKTTPFLIPEIHEEVLGLVVEGVQLERHVWKSWNLAMTFYFLAHCELSNILDMVPSWWQAFFLHWCAKIWYQGKGTNPLEGCQYAQLPMLATGTPKWLIHTLIYHIRNSSDGFTNLEFPNLRFF